MSQTKIIALVVGVVIVAAGGYFLVTKDSAQAPAGSEQQAASGKKIAFSEFVKQKGSYKCTVHQYVSDVDTVGTTYISDGKIRGEYNTKVQGMSIDSTLIVRDGYTYTWTSMAPNMGFKMKVVEGESNASAEASGTYAFNAEQIGDYDCQPWSADESTFALPGGVTFREI